MGISSIFLSRFAALGAVALVATVVGSLAIGLLATSQPTKQDDWRRTSNGWERASSWPRGLRWRVANERVHRAVPLAASTRFDMHPAALALAQLVATLLGLVAFASPTHQRGPKRSIFAAVA